MKKVSVFVYWTCAIFILLGVGTILKGDIENTKEALFMAIYLLFFVTLFFVIKRIELRKNSND